MAQAQYGTIGRVIRQAYVNAGLLEEGQDPNGEQLATGLNRVNDLVNVTAVGGIKLFTLVDTPVTLTAGTSLYTVMPGGTVNQVKSLRVEQAYVLDTSNNRRPVFEISWNEWLLLSNVTTQGPITQIMVDKQYDRLNVNVWLTPDTTEAGNTLHLLLRNEMTNYVALTDSVIVPPEWFMFLTWALADELATGQPQAIMDRCMAKTTYYRQLLEDYDVEDASVRFMPDTRQMTGRRR